MAATLPSLIGSEKQVAWAEKIREKALTIIRNYHGFNVIRDVVTPAAEKITAAKEWIDNREQTDVMLFCAYFGLPAKEGKDLYCRFADRISGNHYSEKEFGKQPDLTIDEDDTRHIVRLAGNREKATEIAAAFGFYLSNE